MIHFKVQWQLRFLFTVCFCVRSFGSTCNLFVVVARLFCLFRLIVFFFSFFFIRTSFERVSLVGQTKMSIFLPFAPFKQTRHIQKKRWTTTFDRGDAQFAQNFIFQFIFQAILPLNYMVFGRCYERTDERIESCIELLSHTVFIECHQIYSHFNSYVCKALPFNFRYK